MQSILTNYVEPFITNYNEVIDTIKENYYNTIDATEAYIYNNLPDRVRNIALSVLHTLPETLVCLSMLTGVGVGLATLYWASRVITVFTPLITAMFTPNCTHETLAEASAHCLENLFSAYRQFRPGIMVASACAGATYLALGWITADYALMIRSTIYIVTASMTGQVLANETM